MLHALTWFRNVLRSPTASFSSRPEHLEHNSVQISRKLAADAFILGSFVFLSHTNLQACSC